MNIPLLDISAQHKPIEDELKAALLDVLDSTRFIMGPKVAELESEIAKYCGAKHAIGVSSGTDALLLALMALGIKAGDSVLTTPYSFFATAGVISRLGATPIFVDINHRSYNLDADLFTQWLEKNPSRRATVKAILPVHLYGQCAELEKIVAAADSYGIPVVEDAAQALGARCVLAEGEKSAGSIGSFGCFSFFPSKNLGGLGDGGMLVSSSDQLAENARIMRNHGAKPKYYHATIGGNFRLDAIQAAVLLVKLKQLDKWHNERRDNAHYYDETLSRELVTPPHMTFGRKRHIFNQYVISVPEKRDELQQFLKDSGVATEVYYPVPFHEQECFSYLNYRTGDFPNSEYAAKHTLALPIYPGLTREMQDYVVAKINEFYGQGK